jgi:two-component system sensor histidine kinase HydH
MPGSSVIRVSVTRWGPLAIALLFGAALVGSAVFNYRDAEYAAQVIAERQGSAIFRRLRLDLNADESSRREALERALDAHEALGLGYLGVWSSGKLTVHAGRSAFAGVTPAPLQLQTAGTRARMTFPAFNWRGPRPESGSAGPGSAGPGASGPGAVTGPGTGPGSGFGPGPGAGALGGFSLPRDINVGKFLVLEFEPIGVVELKRRALVGLWLSSGAAALLMSAALVLWQLGRRSDRMQAELAKQRHLATLGGMSAVLAHEIRNPLASLKGHAQLLAEKTEDPKMGERVRRVVDEALRLESLTNDLLDFAKSGAVDRAPTSPAAILDAAVEATCPARVERSVAGAPDSWPLDAARMEQVLINLLENAMDATKNGQKVSAAVEARGRELVYVVRDRGPGVPPAERARIFEPFHTTKLRGTGLGLAVVRRIVELHGGRVEVDDAPGGGAEFRVRIPRAS